MLTLGFSDISCDCPSMLTWISLRLGTSVGLDLKMWMTHFLTVPESALPWYWSLCPCTRVQNVNPRFFSHIYCDCLDTLSWISVKLGAHIGLEVKMWVTYLICNSHLHLKICFFVKYSFGGENTVFGITEYSFWFPEVGRSAYYVLTVVESALP